MKIYCCAEHVEVGLDNIVDEAEVPPFINNLSDEEGGKVTHNSGEFTCEYCGKPAVYVVANEHSDTICGG
ncbi:CxxH/CxxC protein [Gracilibacillus sp. Marseille-QA3620]